jgi:UDP-glucose 4-epimerase
MNTVKILVTGGSGFIGSHLSERLVREGYDVTTFDNGFTGDNPIEDVDQLTGDITDTELVSALVKDSDFVYHLAGILGTSETLGIINRTNMVNINGTVNVLNACKDADVPVVFSSKPNPIKFLNPYTITKVAGEQYCLMFHKMYGVKVAIPRLMYLYGPRQGVYPAVNYQKFIPTFVTKALLNEDITVYGTGKQVIDPLYIEDCAEALIRIMDNLMDGNGRTNGKVFDIGRGGHYTVNDIVITVLNLIGSRSRIAYAPMRKGEPDYSEVTADTGFIEDVLGYVPDTDLISGLEKTIPYYEKLLTLTK